MSDSTTNTHDELFDSLLGDFLDESGQLLDRLNENLLQLDEWVRSLEDDHSQRCDDELLNDMFRSAHSLKGLSAMLGLDDINNLTHKIENVFDAARKDELIIGADVVELMFQGWDRLVGLIEILKDPTVEPVECESVASGIAELLQSAGVERKQSSQADAERALAESLAPSSGGEPLDNAPRPAVDTFQNIADEAEVSDKYVSIFIDESELALDSITETLLALEGGGSHDELKQLLITSHRIKGSAASVGLNRAAKLAHLIEDLVQKLLEGGGTLSGPIVDAMLKCTDGLRHYLDSLRRGNSSSDHFGELARELLAASSAALPAKGEPAQPCGGQIGDEQRPVSGHQDSASEPARVSDRLRSLVGAAAEAGMGTFAGEVRFQAKLPLAALKAQLVYEKLANLGEVCYCDPPVEKLEQLEEIEFLRFGINTDQPQAAVEAQLRVVGVQSSAVEPLAADAVAGAPAKPSGDSSPQTESPEAAQPESPGTAKPAQKRPPQKTAQAQPRAAEAGSRPTETVRVDIERLDHLMNLAGELVINKARFSRIGDQLKSTLRGKQSVQAMGKVFGTLSRMCVDDPACDDAQLLQAELENLRSMARRIQNDLEPIRRDVQAMAAAHGSVNDLLEAVHQLHRVSDGIQQSVMDTRMVPIGPLFARFKRVIRDITRANGKSINLVINGEKTELDKRMIDELGDPLIHMVRNSADHGIELPDRRQAAGKPRQGTVTLNAFHRGNSIIIQVIDDGKGLDAERILEKCLNKGILSKADAENITPQEIYQMIWEPGLSTAEKVTEVSGRGMGMDIVKSKIEGLNGTVDVESGPGMGTTMSIKLPLTLAILPSLMVLIDGETFAMPMEAVTEIVGLGRRDLATVHGQWTARVRGRVISTVTLDEMLSFHGAGRSAAAESDETTLVIVGEGNKEIGLCVDQVLGEEDVVIKSMAENFRNVTGIAGASILGDGRIALILDVVALIDLASNKNPAAAAC